MTKRKQHADSFGFNTQLKQLIDKHFHGDLDPAASFLGLSAVTLRTWVKGTKVPRFQQQVDALRKLRSKA